MVTVSEHDCWLIAKLTSVAVRDLKINLVDLHINPDYVSFVNKLQNLSEGSLTDSVVRPGESFDVVFKLNIGIMPRDFEIGDLMSLMISMGSGGERSNGRTQLIDAH